jgi:predicted Zn-dependent protease
MKRGIGLLVMLAMCAAPVVAQSNNEKDIKDIGHRGVGTGINFYSLEKEIALGKMLAEQVEASARIVDDPVVNEYVNRVAQNLVRNSDAHVPFTVKVVDSPDINAFALPGGFFFVNTGLILAADEESELAGVMAHEIAHVAARHGTRNATKAEIINYATFPLIFVGGPIGFAGRSVASVAVPLSFLKFSRGAEREADFLGLQYMYKAGYDPQAFVTMFEKIEAMQKKKPGTVSKAYSTHPQTPDRIAASEKEIATILPARPEYVVTTSEFDQIKGRLARLEHQYQTEDKLHGADRPTLEKRGQNKKDKNGKKGSDDDRPVLKPRPD